LGRWQSGHVTVDVRGNRKGGTPAATANSDRPRFYRFTSKERFKETYLDLYEERKIFVDIACGDLNAARAICAYFATDSAKKRYSGGMEEEYDRVTKTLCPLVAAGDRLGLVQLLRDWEASSVEHLKLKRLWEPTPFPIELQREKE
jgi:hypothetical protein